MAQIYDFQPGYVQAEPCGTFGDHFLISKEYGLCYPVTAGGYGCTQHVVGIGFPEHYAFGIETGLFDEVHHHLVFVSHACAQVVFILVPVLYGGSGCAAFHCSLGHCGGYCGEQARVEGFRQDVFFAETHAFHVVCRIYDSRHGPFCQAGDGMYGCQLHLFVDCGRPRI